MQDPSFDPARKSLIGSTHPLQHVYSIQLGLAALAPLVARIGWFDMKSIEQARADLERIFRAGVARVEGRFVVSNYLARNPMDQPCSLIAVGKAAGSMAQGALDLLGDTLLSGLVISKPGHVDPSLLESFPAIQMVEGSHPIPDASSLRAGTFLLDFLAQLPPDRPLLFLISGGTSSLVEVLHEGIGLDDLRRVNRWLLGSGLSIEKMNRVRKSLSAVKGGGLLRYIGERNVTGLLISDVRWDDPAVIGSGLLVANPTEEKVMDPVLPDWIRELMLLGGEVQMASSGTIDLHIVASLHDAREAAAAEARALGYATQVSHAFIGAPAENAGHRLALEVMDSLPGVYVWGGESSVRLPEKPGRGGRNQHLALAAARVIEGSDDVLFLSAGTDGSDGPGDDAGALVDGGSLGRARRYGFDAEQTLTKADSGSLLAASGDLIHTGPTGTNVMDLIIGMRLDGQANDLF